MPDLNQASAEVRIDIRGGLPAGTRLGRYELKAILGKGAFGITYRALDLAGGDEVAIKEYLPTSVALREGRTTVLPISTDLAEQFAWGRTRFLEEANTLKKLEGTPSIVSVHDFLEANGTAYMVMALIEGETLAKRLMREERLAAAVIEPLLFPLLDGLEKVHAAGFLHRDIKPANIMIDVQGKPTLIDFGASRAALAGRSTTFTAIFTPGYAALEQFASTKLGPSTDIYGLAATLYHAIAGRAPPSAIERMIKDEYQTLTDLQPAGYSLAFLESIDAGLAVASADRPQSVGEWRRMLSSSLEATRIARSPGRIARVASRTRRAQLRVGAPAIGLISVAALALLGGAGYFALTANAPPTVSTAALSLSVEQLEQALAERRRAEALAADKRRQEEEARQKAEAEAEAKRFADAELERVRQARREAEQKVAELKARSLAEDATQRRAEAEAAALRLIEAEAHKKAEAEAEAKRQADEALAKVEAERRQAEEAARAKAEAEQAALRQASEGAQRKAADAESVKQAEQERLKAEAEREKAQAERQKAEAELKLRAEAEVAEKTLRLDQPARERLQLALTSLGFDTRGSDGIFGARTREMIGAWQKTRGQPPTGFVTGAQQQALLKEATVALAKYDEQKKTEEEAKRISVAAATTGASPNSSPPAGRPDAAVSTGTMYDGTYSGIFSGSHLRVDTVALITNGRGTLTVTARGCETSRLSLTVSPAGFISGGGTLNCVFTSALTGPVEISSASQTHAGQLTLNLTNGHNSVLLRLRRGSAESPPASPSPDGLWRGAYECQLSQETSAAHQPFRNVSFQLELQLINGAGRWKADPDARNGNTVDLAVSVQGNSVTMTRTSIGWGNSAGQRVTTLSGRFRGGNTIEVDGADPGPPRRDCALRLQR